MKFAEPMTHYLRALWAITWRELLRFFHQRGRFFAALVRPLVWLFIFAAGFRATLGISVIPPYQTYVLYEEYITPGLVGMILLFQGMQSSLSMVYDREMGSMRILLVAPLPRWYLLTSKLFAATLVAALQAYIFLAIAWFYEIQPPLRGYLYALPAILMGGMMVGALGMFLSSLIRQLENFAGVMNFVIFPMFFLSTALYPLWRLEEANPYLALLARYNPFSQMVEAIRFALYGQFHPEASLYTAAALLIFLISAIWGYHPSKGMMRRRG